ncbi:hypothetical protein B7P34_29140 [Streptosporangium nondiastaticum]|uniref:Uncharacterized protein n=1 Tax=Streptosporangium nondiastaticum TaxID=35764 RepID=A0A9X7JK54_9ACTN|nr:hypothetical protein [Streptosporangium nondiastaticum]PSJ25248.1 hypothetical protein B7P34_29140 [Streptosporangium nondiastaticum]
MTPDQVLDRCRTEWMFHDMPRDAVDDMLTELREHLEDSARAGRSAAVVVGDDVAAFASSWAAEHPSRPPRNTPGLLARHAYAGSVALLSASHLVGRTAEAELVPGSVAAVCLFSALMTFTPYWRAVLHWPLWRWTALSCTGFAVLLALFLIGREPVLLRVPWWATALLLLPGLAASAVSWWRGKRREHAAST